MDQKTPVQHAIDTLDFEINSLKTWVKPGDGAVNITRVRSAIQVMRRVKQTLVSAQDKKVA